MSSPLSWRLASEGPARDRQYEPTHGERKRAATKSEMGGASTGIEGTNRVRH